MTREEFGQALKNIGFVETTIGSIWDAPNGIRVFLNGVVSGAYLINGNVVKSKDDELDATLYVEATDDFATPYYEYVARVMSFAELIERYNKILK